MRAFLTRCLSACGAVLLLAVPAAPAHAQGGDVLPDLDQLVPRGLVAKQRVVEGQRVVRLGFSSAAANVGRGPLTLHGYREGDAVPAMRVDQLIDQVEGADRLVRDVGQMSFVVHPDHNHWHLLDFERYEIRSVDDAFTLGTDRKTGFCLGDRYALRNAGRLPGFKPTPLQGDTCGLGQPGLTSLFAGISVGWADRYAPHLEGQYIDITHLPSGNYVLVHRLNLDGRIAESDYTNNASSVRFSIERQGRERVPKVRVINRCPGVAFCSRPRCNTLPEDSERSCLSRTGRPLIGKDR